jgi:glycosyltransferase involved in cell wall biosynthesis
VTQQPSVSVIIPTRARPVLLNRAIDSCLSGIAPGPVEVIVVVNGAAPGSVALPGHDGVRVVELEAANANAARNVGLALARGQYIRFLDDDDYLIPEGALHQYELAARSGADVCTGAIRLQDPEGRELQTIKPEGADFVASVLSPRQTTATTAHLYRRDALADVRWDPDHRHYQDVYWMHEIVRRSEVTWVSLREVVGVWEHHRGARISTGNLKRFPEQALAELESIIDETVDVLIRDSRLAPPRRSAAAEALWHCAHHGFPMQPFRWSRTARKALGLDPSAVPVPSFGKSPWRHFHPLAIEWAMLPKRRINALLRRMKNLRRRRPC